MSDLNIDQSTLWRRWQDEQDDTAYDELITSLDPLIRSQLNQWQTNPINQTALRGYAYSLVRDALPSWDPEKGQISTHVVNSLKPIHRYVKTYQNPSYVPERVANEFGNVQRARDELKDELNRRPTIEEIAYKVRMKPDKVERIMGGMATSVPISAVLDEADQDRENWTAMASIDDRNMHFLRAELKGMERRVFDFIAREAKKRGGPVPPRIVAEAFKIPVEDVYKYKRNWTRRLEDVGIQ